MKKLFFFFCIFFINLSFCSADQKQNSMHSAAQVRATNPSRASLEAEKYGPKAKRIVIGTLFTIAAAQSISLLILANSSTENNATQEPVPAPFVRYATRLTGSLPVNQKLNASNVYSQELNFMLNNTRRECAPRFLCNTSEAVADVEKKALEEVALECSDMPTFVVAQTLTERLDDEDYLFRCDPDYKEWIEDWSEGVFDCIKETCAILKAQYANAFCPQQPRVNFAVAAGSNLEKNALRKYARQRSKRENNSKSFKRGNFKGKFAKGKNKR